MFTVDKKKSKEIEKEMKHSEAICSALQSENMQIASESIENRWARPQRQAFSPSSDSLSES